MRRASRAALAAAAWLLIASASRAETSSVTVVDRLSEGQKEETITVYFAGRMAGTVHIDRDHPEDQFTTAIGHMAHTPYTLCGKLVRQEADGSETTHPIDNSGLLGDVAGQTLFANTIGNVLFSLNLAEGGSPGEVRPGPACSAAVAGL